MFPSTISAMVLLVSGRMCVATENRSARALASTNDATVQTSNDCGNQQGKCSEADFKVMWKMGPGTSGGTFPKKNSECGVSSYGIFSGLDKKAFVSCLGDTGLSGLCSDCFAGAAAY